MNKNENNKSMEALADEAMDAVAGGTIDFGGPQTLTQKEIEELLAGQEVEGQRKR